ncbi:MAG: DUF4874 domain-containing protein [Coriobacteriales bacterium]|jgi:hypothetical protein
MNIPNPHARLSRRALMRGVTASALGALACAFTAGKATTTGGGRAGADEAGGTAAPVDDCTLAPGIPACAPDRGLLNPRRGFYRLLGITPADDEQVAPDLDGAADGGVQLVLLEVNLRNYRDRELSPTALSQVASALDACVAAGLSPIVRYLYDWDGLASQTEPDDVALIEAHMRQVAGVNNDRAGVLLGLQGLFVGDVGEMHGSAHLAPDEMAALAQTLADASDPRLFLAVRTPAQKRQIESLRPALAGRYGLFDDGIFGSGTDLSTFGDVSAEQASAPSDALTRDDELSFESAWCQTLLNGGEAVSPGYVEQQPMLSDLVRMRLTYLSCEYDPALLQAWAQQPFDAPSYATMRVGLQQAIDEPAPTLGYEGGDGAAGAGWSAAEDGEAGGSGARDGSSGSEGGDGTPRTTGAGKGGEAGDAAASYAMDDAAADAVTRDALAFASSSLYDFVGAHLGFRIVPEAAWLERDGQTGSWRLRVCLVNVGFASPYRELAVRATLAPEQVGAQAAEADADEREMVDLGDSPDAASMGWQPGRTCVCGFELDASALVTGDYGVHVSVRRADDDVVLELACAGDQGDDDAEGATVRQLAARVATLTAP